MKRMDDATRRTLIKGALALLAWLALVAAGTLLYRQHQLSEMVEAGKALGGALSQFLGTP